MKEIYILCKSGSSNKVCVTVVSKYRTTKFVCKRYNWNRFEQLLNLSDAFWMGYRSLALLNRTSNKITPTVIEKITKIDPMFRLVGCEMKKASCQEMVICNAQKTVTNINGNLDEALDLRRGSKKKSHIDINTLYRVLQWFYTL